VTLRIERGLCYAIFAYDAARSIDLAEAERCIQQTSHRETLQHRRRAPKYFEYEPPPLRVSLGGKALAVAQFSTAPSVDLLLYDFGAVSVTYTIPIDVPFEELLNLSEALYDHANLLEDSRERVNQLLRVVGTAANQANLQPLVEDYVVFHVESFAGSVEALSFCSEQRQLIARILRAETEELSAEEVEDALSARISYGTGDVAILDWNAALLVDPKGDDVRAVLEFANVELLELRYLDRKLDRALDQSYETLLKSRPQGWLRWIGHYGSELRGVAELQVDNAALFEGVNNALKLIGDQYLARAYRLASRRFHLDEWDAGILRKLQTLESTYEKISDQASNRRMEVLEWVIIILIAVSIVIPYI
jgi:hypothetical protein